MNCQRHETGLLLLVHNAAGPVQSWWLRRHLRTCIACQARYAQLRSASYALAGGIRGADADLPPWRPVLGPASSARAARLWARPISVPALLVATAATAGAAVVAYQVYAAYNPPPVACPTPIIATPPPIARSIAFPDAPRPPRRGGRSLKVQRPDD